MTPLSPLTRRWYVLADATPVDWSTAVRHGRAADAIFAVTCDPGVTIPWVVLWLPRGHPCPPEQIAWARDHTDPGPVPELRRQPPASTRPPAPQLRVIRGGRP